ASTGCTMKPLVVFSLLVAVVAAQHPAHVGFDPNAIISELHAQFPTVEAPIVEELPPPVRGVPQRSFQPAPTQRPRQRQLARQRVQNTVQVQPVHLQAGDRPIGQVPGHLVNQMARLQAPKVQNKFTSPAPKVLKDTPIKKWKGPYAHEFGAGVKGPVEHTQFTPEVVEAHKLLAQAHVNHFRQVAQIDGVKTQEEQFQQTQVFPGQAGTD
ncbi:unnamed protein product, partial [Meganyctiphanes norvegica]